MCPHKKNKMRASTVEKDTHTHTHWVNLNGMEALLMKNDFSIYQFCSLPLELELGFLLTVNMSMLFFTVFFLMFRIEAYLD